MTSGALICLALISYASREALAPKPRALPAVPPTVTPSSDPPIVIGVNDFGGAYPLLLAKDGALPEPRSLFMKSRLNVEVRWVPGSKERIRDFDRGEIHGMEPAQATWSFALERLLREKNLSGEMLSGSFTYDVSKLERAQPLLTKPLSIYFARGSSELKPEAQETVDQVSLS